MKVFHKSLDVLNFGTKNSRSYYIPFESEAKSLSLEREDSKYFLSLCGEWDFKYYDCDYKEEKEISARLSCLMKVRVMNSRK